MSYTILYRAAFLKLGDGTYAPVGEVGDSNVWHGNRRAREWSNRWNKFQEKPGYTEEEILSTANETIESKVSQYEGTTGYQGDHVRTREEILENFGFYSGLKVQGLRNTTANQFMGWFRKGIRNARTLDEMKGLGVTVRLEWDEGTEDGYTERKGKAVETEEELLAKYAEKKAKGCFPYISYDCVHDHTYRMLTSPRPDGKGKEQGKGFVINITGIGYVERRTPSRIIANRAKERAHVYASKGTTTRMIAIINRNGYCCTIEEAAPKPQQTTKCTTS